MNQIDFLKTVVGTLEAQGVAYMVVGSFVSSRFGEARFTNDVDIVIDVSETQVLSLCKAFPVPEFYWSQQAALDAVRTRRQFNIIHSASANKVDFMIVKQTPWGKLEFSRRSRRSIGDECVAFTASPEDVILAKMSFYQEGGSDKHLRDITGILRITGNKVDREYILEWAQHLGLNEVWQMILERLK